ncbi:MAG TPA: nucleoside-diphosphate sugar epimerase/dehydratase [Cyclobacteriaceae bacterium]|nr:nucleoside-diphosphate sugar epimerase/dehydratase [Cyclobacteriaceae bacterium]
MTFLKRLNILPRWLIASIDGMILFMSAFFAFLIRLNFDWESLEDYHVFDGSLLFLGSGLVVMYFTKSYVGIVRHTRLRDGKSLVKTIIYNFTTVILLNFLLFQLLDIGHLIPNSVVIIASLLSLFTLVMYRLMVKDIFSVIENKKEKKEIKRVIIFGAGEAGILTHDVIKKDRIYSFINCGFLDDDINKQGKIIDGIKIYGGLESLEALVHRREVTDLILSVQDISDQRKREIIDECLALNLHVSIIPPVAQWVNGGLEPGSIREVKIEDLLGRESIALDNVRVSEDIQGKVVLVTGAAGSIGSELSRQIIHYNPQLLILLDQAESALYDVEQDIKAFGLSSKIEVVLADIRNSKKVNEVFNRFRPQIVFHAAAYKHVPMMEKYPEEAIRCNIKGTKLLADVAVLNNVEKFVLVSTDKAVNPTNVMGASKRIAEMYVQALNGYLDQNGTSTNHTRFITTRFGNVLGSNGSVIPLFKKQISRGGPITVTDPEITRYFMTIPEACELVLEAAVMGNGGEIYVFDMGKPIKIVDLAKRMIQLSGKKIGEDISIVYTGLREGEKLYEELLNDSEEVKITHHPKIKIAKVRQVSYLKIDSQIDIFDSILHKNNEDELVRHIKVIVPEYISNASRFGVLDRMN